MPPCSRGSDPRVVDSRTARRVEVAQPQRPGADEERTEGELTPDAEKRHGPGGEDRTRETAARMTGPSVCADVHGW
jgi:hypothetical protein